VLAKKLAKLATRIRNRVNIVLAVESEKGPMRQLHKAFQQILIHDLSEDDFADMYAQTITYGLFSTKKSRPAGLVAENLVEIVPRTNPFLRELLSTFLTLGGRTGKINFDELGIDDVVQTLRNTDMDAVLRDFGDSKPEEDPVIHFYEDFLKEYDAKKKVKRGVFYTPKPVVSFIVRSVHEILQKEFGLEYGLADTTTWGDVVRCHKEIRLPEGVSENEPFVQILDPAAGTGTFLVEAIGIIHKTMREKWEKEGHLPLEFEKLWNEYIPRHLLPRLHGFELMMAPYAIAHMKIGLKLFETGYRFGSDERARVYLTNALEPAQGFSGTLPFAIPALAHEAEAVSTIKRDQRFTVVIGNPPYSKLSANREPSAESFVLPFKERVRGEANIQPLSDDYLKFLGFALSTISAAQYGLVGMITNRGYLGGLIHRGVREVLFKRFNAVYAIDLHGDSNVGEQAPGGQTNENVFDIKQGVAISICARFPGDPRVPKRHDIWGTRGQKYSQLRDLTFSTPGWTSCTPRDPNFFLDSVATEENAPKHWLPITEIMPVTNTGIKTHRDELVIDFDKSALTQRMRRFLDANRSDDDVRSEFFGETTSGRYLPGDNRDWSMSEARRSLTQETNSVEELIHRIDYRPFDTRYIFYSSAAIDFPRRNVMDHMINEENLGLITTRQVPNSEFCHALVTRRIVETKLASHDRAINIFPLHIMQGSSLIDGTRQHANLSEAFLRGLASALRSLETDVSAGSMKDVEPEKVFGFIYAVLYSPSYRRKFRGTLKIDFPRIPLPGCSDLFHRLSRLGEKLTALHLLESPQLDTPLATYDSPSSRQVEKVSYSDETVWIDKAKTRGFRVVPENVWNFHIGGYQVCRKWLKDRGPKKGNPGRVLIDEDIDHYQKIVVALSETIRIMAEIDEVIKAHGGWPDAFVTDK